MLVPRSVRGRLGGVIFRGDGALVGLAPAISPIIAVPYVTRDAYNYTIIEEYILKQNRILSSFWVIMLLGLLGGNNHT